MVTIMTDRVAPFPRCPALDGYHCQTNSLAKIFHSHGHPLSEDMLLGLGAGMGFMYWEQKGMPPFVGGRGNTKDFFQDIARRTGVSIEESTTSSEGKAEERLLSDLRAQVPVMLFGDMGFLPWFDLPEDYHFGGHTFVVCGYDGQDTVLASDMDQKSGGKKKGFYSALTLKELRKARSSPHKPFPPKNAALSFDFTGYRDPAPADIIAAIRQEVAGMLDPPISNFGVKGIRRTAREMTSWPQRFSDHDLRMCLFTLYIFIEIGGTGGGCFRPMYSRFLREAAGITPDDRLIEAADEILASGRMLSELGLLFKDAEHMPDLDKRLAETPERLNGIADREQGAFEILRGACEDSPATRQAGTAT